MIKKGALLTPRFYVSHSARIAAQKQKHYIFTGVIKIIRRFVIESHFHDETHCLVMAKLKR